MSAAVTDVVFSKVRTDGQGGATPGFMLGVLMLAVGFFTPEASLADTLQIECDVQFQVPVSLKDNAAKNNITSDLLATVPFGLNNFQSYSLAINWDAKEAKVYTGPLQPPSSAPNFPPTATYKLASEKSWPFIKLTDGSGSTYIPILFYIRRASGWFAQYRSNPPEKTNPPEKKDAGGPPVVDIIDVGVCGGQPKF